MDSIADGTTLPLYYQLAPNEMLVPHETLDKEFLSLAEAEGVADIDELNKILERAKIREAFGKHPGWKDGEAELRGLRKQVTFAVYDEEEDLDKVTATVESLFMLLEKAFRK